MTDTMDYIERPPSDQMVDIHVYQVPLEFWREQLNSAVNQIIDETISIGFIRVYPDSNLPELRRDIAVQLGDSDAGLPSDYTFLRSVGRCFTRVKAIQESQLKAKNFIPPQAYAPEIFILEGPPDNRSSVGHPFSRWSADRSVQNSSDTVRTSRSDGPYKRLPAISNSRNQSPANRTEENGDENDRHSRSERRNSDEGYNNDDDKGANDNWDKERWEQRPGSKDEARNEDKQEEYRHRERTLPPLSASPTQIRLDDDRDKDGRRDDDPTPPANKDDHQGPPLSATPPHSRRSSPKQRDRSRSTNSRRQASEENGYNSHRDPNDPTDRYYDDKENQPETRRDAWNSFDKGYDDKDRYEDRNGGYDRDQDRYEDHADRNNYSDNNYRDGNYQDNNYGQRDDGNSYRDDDKNDPYNSNDPSKRQFSSIQEENEEYRRDNDRYTDRRDGKESYRDRSPSRHSPNGRRSSRSPDNKRRESPKSKSELLRELDQARRERQEVERKREELVKRAKHLQGQTQQKRNQARDIWKKKYFEEKKKTPPLEEQVNRLRIELENLHQRIITQLEGSKEDGMPHEKPSSFNNLKLQATKTSHEITDLQRRVENVKMKLTGEIKLRKQAEVELKALKAELTQKKINLTLTRSQNLQSGGSNSNLSNSHNGFSAR